MVTVRDKKSGMEIQGEHIRTSKYYVFLNIDGRTQCFAKNEWEVVRNEIVGSIESVGRESEEEV